MEKDSLDPLRKVLAGAHRDQLRKYHRAGELVMRLRPKKGHRADKENKLADIAAAVGCSVGLLYSLRDFAATYKRADLPRLQGLSWSKVRYLSRLPRGKPRRQMERWCLLEFWTVLRLREEIRERFGARPRASSPPSIPVATTGAQLRTLARMIDRWEACHGQWFANKSPKWPKATRDERFVVVAGMDRMQQLLRDERRLLMAG